jgi:phosphoglycerol transferase MdoB-like AlkP superfamily enzyme
MTDINNTIKPKRSWVDTLGMLFAVLVLSLLLVFICMLQTVKFLDKRDADRIESNTQRQAIANAANANKH